MLPLHYSKAVLACYRQKSKDGDLSLHLKQLSPASFKEACLQVRRERFNRKDELPLKAFFGEGVDKDVCLQAINRMEIDKFRPLVNFLKQKTQSPDDKVVELVAWLIDFKDRPYDPGKDYSASLPQPQVSPTENVFEPALINPSGNDNGSQLISPEPIRVATTIISSQKGKKSTTRKGVILTIIISVAFGIGLFWLWRRKSTFSKPIPPQIEGQACMYWAEDHYQPISCNQKLVNTQIIALDSEKVYHLRKITRPDTITFSAVGSVWYVRYLSGYEFYTDSGFHPLDPSLRLKPLTEYIIRHHVPANP